MNVLCIVMVLCTELGQCPAHIIFPLPIPPRGTLAAWGQQQFLLNCVSQDSSEQVLNKCWGEQGVCGQEMTQESESWTMPHC
jgi:hypothetical protein